VRDGPTNEAQGWFQRLKTGLGRSSRDLTRNLASLLVKRRLDRALLDELEEVLIAADLGPALAARLTGDLAENRFDKDISETEIREAFAAEIARVLAPVAKPLVPGKTRPHVVLVVGVNGSGKTTTIGKLAHFYRRQGRSVLLVAGDTFRAAAVEQLKIWGTRAGVDVLARETGADAAGLAYEALAKARAEGTDLLLIDTAGRLQNKDGLMQELAKIARVLKKLDPTAPQDCLLVLDATVGQNALSQVEIFKQVCQVTGLVVTKLDGSAKAGILVALAERFGLPVVAIGVGEGIDDLRPFAAGDFARSLMGLEGPA
jgi:fused signal recognition particle receptor